MPSARIILVEDHVMVRQLFAHVISDELGLALAADCTTLAEGRAAVRRESPDLAIVDWQLPDGLGLDLVRELARERPATRWMLVSATERGDLVREAAALGVHGFVMKRSDLPTWRDGVRQVLAGGTYYCPISARLLVERMVDDSHAPAGGVLTERERAVLRGFAAGASVKILAADLGMNVRTVQNHLASVRDKLGLHEPAELVRYAIRHGYTEAP
jgi:two-component system, NarL family, nitrate/nitrite response regulator NarL